MNEQGTPVVQLDSLVVQYGRIRALDDLSLRVEPGQVYALLGRNGAGKSSLVRCLLGVQKPQHGSAHLFGDDVWKHRSRLMRRVGVVPEEADAPPDMTSRQILEFSSGLYPRWDGRTAEQRLERFRIDRSVPFGQLSKGQKRGVLLAAALASEPDLLVLDDPTLGLDVVSRKELFEEIVAELADRGTTVFLTTHDLAGVEGIADRVGILDRGRLALDESLETLKQRFRRIRWVAPAATVPASPPVPGMRRWGAGAEAIVSDYGDDALERLRHESGAQEIDVSPMSLEEIFIAVSSQATGGAS